MDKRKGLKSGHTLAFYKENGKIKANEEFCIRDEIGRGGSCIVYDGSYLDSAGMRHWRRLKECYPYILDLQRDETGRLIVPANQKEEFRKAQSDFLNAYRKHVEIKNNIGLVNSTVDASEIYSANNTWYYVMDYEEVRNYGEIKEETLQVALKRTIAIAGVVDKYHQAGFLHLDIKPENVLILPETNELVRLFDFDSVIRKEELPEAGSLTISYTEGFAAPELVSGNLGRIGEVTDIYGIGALLFFKLMGRCPQREDRERGAEYDFTELEKNNPFCRPRFFKELSEFFKKTLAAVRRFRFQTMSDVITGLNRLISLSDVEGVCPVTNFSYNRNCFIGRRDELEEIGERLEETHILFLHGIGGIGKTELAMGYGQENRKKYHTILFLRYENSLLDSLCSDDILLHNFSREDESQEEYWKRKMKALKESLSDKDLLILDNFDTEEEELLEDFMDLPCRILITTRIDFSVWNYPQLEVGELKDKEEIYELFLSYNDRDYTGEEAQAIRDIIELVDRHTMTVELIAKNLAVSHGCPIEIKEELLKEQGIVNIGKQEVCHRKDRKRLRTSVQSHLKMLFDITGFQEEEYYILENLSLLSGVCLNQEQFLNWCGDCKKELLEGLIQRGWIERNRQDGKISLHQIILDFIYDERKPDGKRCCILVEKMTEYAEKKLPNRTETAIRNRLCGILCRRLKAGGEETAAYYLACCEHIKYQDSLIEACIREYEKDESRWCGELSKVYFLKGKAGLKAIDSLELPTEEEQQQNTAENIKEDFDKSIKYKAEAIKNQDCEYGKYLFEIGELCMDTLDFQFMLEEKEAISLYGYSVDCMERGVRIYENGEGQDKLVLLSMYQVLSEFYDGDSISFIRAENFGDAEKMVFYSRKKETLQPPSYRDGEGNEVIDCSLMAVSYGEAGNQAERQGNYEAAERCYAAALEDQDIFYDNSSLGMLYEKMGQLEKAIEFFEQHREAVDGADCHLCRLYKKTGQLQKAVKHGKQGIEECRKKWNEDQGEYWLTLLLSAYLELSRIPGEVGVEARKKGAQCYHDHEDFFRKETGALEFIMEYAECRLQEKDYEGSLKLLLDAARICMDSYKKEEGQWISEKINKILDHTTDQELIIDGLEACGRLLELDLSTEDYRQEAEYYEEALKRLEETGKGTGPQAMMLRHKLETIYVWLDQEKKAQEHKASCNYETIAWFKEQQALSDNTMDQKERFQECMEIWQEGGDLFRDKGDDRETVQAAIKCYERAVAWWNRLGERERTDKFIYYSRVVHSLAELELCAGNLPECAKLLKGLHDKALDLYQKEEGKQGQVQDVLEELTAAYKNTGQERLALQCILEKGIVALREIYQTPARSLEGAAEIFFSRVGKGLTEEEKDGVLEICDNILKTTAGAEETIQKNCLNIIKQYREVTVSFKK